MDQIKKAMIVYKSIYGELPPPGDNCSACSNLPNSTWTYVMDALVNSNVIGAAQRIDRDPGVFIMLMMIMTAIVILGVLICGLVEQINGVGMVMIMK